MDLNISEKKAIVCASSRGLGKACAESLAKEGVEITINGVNEENLKKTEEEFKSKGYKVSSVLGAMEDESTRDNLLQACPEPDILINNSGGPRQEIFLIGVRMIFCLQSNQISLNQRCLCSQFYLE